MDNQFSCGHHGDICLEEGEQIFNLGYNYASRIPVVPGLFYQHETGKNLFGEIPVTGRVDLDSSLEQFLERVSDFLRKLPVSEEEFNREMPWFGFCSGNNRDCYKWILSSGVLRLQFSPREKPAEEVLALSSESSRNFVRDYASFLKSEPRLQVPFAQLGEIARRLR